MTPLLVLVVVVLAFSALGYYSYVRTKQRRELLQQFALGEGWTWTQRDDSWSQHYQGAPFGEGDHREAKNVLQGQFRGRAMVAFDYSYQTHSSSSRGGSSTQTHRFAFCALVLPSLVPKLELVPESRLGRLGTALGMQDIELESEDFNRRYRVRSNNPKFASDALPARTMQKLLTREALHLRLAGTDALCWEQGTHSPSQLLARLDALSAVLEGIPEFVWNDLKGNTS